eukprot:1823134-Pyramimonas_sp.AAC.1
MVPGCQARTVATCTRYPPGDRLTFAHTGHKSAPPPRAGESPQREPIGRGEEVFSHGVSQSHTR